MSLARGICGYAAVSAAAEEDLTERHRSRSAGTSFLASAWRTQGVCSGRRPQAVALVLTLLAASAAVAQLRWHDHGHRMQTGTVLQGAAPELEEAAPLTFMATSYGARGCPSGTISVASSELCKQYAATVQHPGLCAKSGGYGPDCDGPMNGRAPWCSARPLGCWQSRNGCTYFKVSGSDEPQLDVRPICQIVGRGPPSPDSLYCVSLLATSTDHRLLLMQQREGLGVFACDNYTVYSEEERELAPGTTTSAIHVKTACSQGGASNECFDARTFIEVWKHVLSAGRFRQYAWTLKIDADAVFVPDRVRAALHGLWDPPRGVYIVNCRRGDHFDLRGPLETFSRNALEIYGKGLHRCLEGPNRLDFDQWSEAFYMDECMKRLGVYRRLDEKFLLEPGCNALDLANSHKTQAVACDHGSYVAFHPFKQEEAYRRCAGTAGQTGPSASL